MFVGLSVIPVGRKWPVFQRPGISLDSFYVASRTILMGSVTTVPQYLSGLFSHGDFTVHTTARGIFPLPKRTFAAVLNSLRPAATYYYTSG